MRITALQVTGASGQRHLAYGLFAEDMRAQGQVAKTAYVWDTLITRYHKSTLAALVTMQTYSLLAAHLIAHGLPADTRVQYGANGRVKSICVGTKKEYRAQGKKVYES